MPKRAPFTPCGARLKRRAPGAHPYCKNAPLVGSNRCRLHGGASTGPRTQPSPEAQQRRTAAMVAGRKAWVAKIQKLKADGEIERFPGGRRKGFSPRPSATGDRRTDRLLARADRAYRALTTADAAPADAAAPSAAPPASLAVKLDAAARTGIERLHAILLLPVTVSAQDRPTAPPVVDPRRLRAVQAAACEIVALATRVQTESLRTAHATVKAAELVLRLKSGASPT